MTVRLTPLIPATLICLALSGCARGPVAEEENESRLEAQVKVELVRAPELQAAAIDVQARDGVVHLSGFVESADHIQRAVEVTRGVPGVRSVTTDLNVK